MTSAPGLDTLSSNGTTGWSACGVCATAGGGGLELRDIDAFVQAADTGTFTAAASRLYTTQPSLSRRIARLEQGVGGALFDRSNRRVLRLSPLGEEILPHARQLLAEYDRFLVLSRARSQGRDGTVTVAVPVAVTPLVLPRLYALIERYLPDVRMRLVEIPGRAGVSAALLAGEAEIGIIDPTLVNDDLESVTFGLVTQVALGDPAILGADGSPIEWAELTRLPLLLAVLGSDLEGVPGVSQIAVVHELGVPSTLFAMAESGHGVAVLAGYAARDGLARRPVAVSGTVQRIRLQLAWRRGTVLATPVSRLIRELRQRLATLEPADLDESPHVGVSPQVPLALEPRHTNAVSRDVGLALEA